LIPDCGNCQKVCYANAITISGRYLTVAEVLDLVDEDREFYERTGGGVTFSGGEPLMQPVFLEAMAREAKTRNLNTAIETCGFAKWETVQTCLKDIDMVLFDLKHMDSAAHSHYTGVSNDMLLENLRKIDLLGKPIRARMPLVPGFNDSIKNIRATAAFAAGLKNIQALDILPYHRMGEPKWGQLDRSYNLHGIVPLFEEHANALADIAREYGIDVTLGG
jgi:pyruvate formate lyase activating enzyme